MPDTSLRSEAYTALSGQPPVDVCLVTLWGEYRKLHEALNRAWRDGKTLKVTIQEVPK